ncbi:MAG: hypothetical protein KKG00_04500, partial [Bacteroidetes bacterium]|nr:hypothetical protein [Bacteroidota bacterium]
IVVAAGRTRAIASRFSCRKGMGFWAVGCQLSAVGFLFLGKLTPIKKQSDKHNPPYARLN